MGRPKRTSLDQRRLYRGLMTKVMRYRRRIALMLLIGLLFLAVVHFLSGASFTLRFLSPPESTANVVPLLSSDASSQQTLSSRFLTRPDGRGGTVRVMLAALSTSITPATCYTLASAYFTGLPFVILGYNASFSSYMQKQWTYDAAPAQAGLRDEDVFVAFDADVLFNGQDMIPYIDRFIQTSPASAAEIDVRAIRAGKATAPVVYYAESYCWAPQTLHSELKGCKKKYADVDEAIERFCAAHNITYDPAIYERNNPLRFGSPGVALHRVWALRELSEGMRRFMHTNRPLDNNEWWCDQSVQLALYNDLRLWEVTAAVLNDTRASERTNAYGLHPGLLSLDYTGQLGVTFVDNLMGDFEMTSEPWNYTDGNGNHVYTSVPENYVTANVDAWFGARKSHIHYTRRYLNHSLGPSITIDIAPPIFSLIPRRLHGEGTTPVRVYPFVQHFVKLNKLPRMREALVYNPWYVVMRHDANKRRAGRDYLLNMPVELWSSTHKMRALYKHLCPVHPFSESTP